MLPTILLGDTARVLGGGAATAVGATGSLLFLLLGFTLGAANGLSIPVAKAFGSGDMPAMRRHVAEQEDGALMAVPVEAF